MPLDPEVPNPQNEVTKGPDGSVRVIQLLPTGDQPIAYDVIGAVQYVRSQRCTLHSPDTTQYRVRCQHWLGERDLRSRSPRGPIAGLVGRKGAPEADQARPPHIAREQSQTSVRSKAHR